MATGCNGDSHSAALASAAPTYPTGSPITAAGRTAPAACSSSRRARAVGALPITQRASSGKVAAASSTAAAERVLPGGAVGTWSRKQRAAATVGTPATTMRESQTTGAPAPRAAAGGADGLPADPRRLGKTTRPRWHGSSGPPPRRRRPATADRSTSSASRRYDSTSIGWAFGRAKAGPARVGPDQRAQGAQAGGPLKSTMS